MALEVGRPDSPPLSMRGVSLRYPGAGASAIDDVSLVVVPGEIIGVVGQSGSGKSTLARLATGQLRPTGGVVEVDGVDTATVRPQVSAAAAGLVYQNPDHQLFARSVDEELRLGPRNAGVRRSEEDARVRDVVVALGLEGVLEAHPARLSMALRKRVAVAAVLTMRTRLLVLDEPTTGRDGPGATWVTGVVGAAARAGTAVIVVTHDLALVAGIASRVVVLAAGRMVLEGPPGVVLADATALGEAGLEPPAVVRVATALGVGTGTALTLDELERATQARWQPGASP